MKRLISAVLLFAVMACAQAPRQPGYTLPQNQMYAWIGAPCSYATEGTYDTGVGCWGEGLCVNGYQIYVSFYQDWYCQYGSVFATGNSKVEYFWDYRYYGDQAYAWGLAALGTADVSVPGMVDLPFEAVDEMNCSTGPAGETFTGMYSYPC